MFFSKHELPDNDHFNDIKLEYISMLPIGDTNIHLVAFSIDDEFLTFLKLQVNFDVVMYDTLEELIIRYDK